MKGRNTGQVTVLFHEHADKALSNACVILQKASQKRDITGREAKPRGHGLYKPDKSLCIAAYNSNCNLIPKTACFVHKRSDRGNCAFIIIVDVGDKFFGVVDPKVFCDKVSQDCLVSYAVKRVCNGSKSITAKAVAASCVSDQVPPSTAHGGSAICCAAETDRTGS